MRLLDDNLIIGDIDDNEATHELAEEDKDFIKILERMAVEVEEEADNSTGEGKGL